ncbi:uncharacterized protein DUF2865 [Roseiarcus fermentans]|uniref:Uncharacterized protein DUF2865 n=1 Tax=Roseiarcus fermentans TaxID=1473586 RepID=A0A366FJT2_9HYPH|nr:DUF2865 domain-containing protein [Roseiarcus fermentans]RBP14366.1 uncharacterized protein DUF2865 [Roseiarcus fermentans]
MVRVSLRLASGRAPDRRKRVAFLVRGGAAATTIVLAIAGFAGGNGPAFAQATGCGRCTITIGPFSFPNPFASPEAAAPIERAHRNGERRGGDSQSRRRAASANRDGGHGLAADAIGGAVYVCVRTCDGSFFPLPFAGSSGSTLAQICQALCPNAEMALYTMPFGGTIDQGVSQTGARYTAEPNALKFQQSYEENCSCRRPGQSWADALAAAEAKYGHRAHELVVTEEASAQMSRPKPDPNAKPTARNAAYSKDQPDDGQPLAAATIADPDPDLDANGVDTRLKAATAAVSRETSGITAIDIESGSRFGLKDGRVVQDSNPEGGRRRVRILAPLF